MREIVVGDDDRPSVEIEVGGSAVVRLPNWADGGFLWSVRGDPALVDAMLVPPARDGPADAEGPVPGRAEPVSYAIRLVAPGDHELAFVLARPWEGTPRRTVVLRVTGAMPVDNPRS